MSRTILFCAAAMLVGAIAMPTVCAAKPASSASTSPVNPFASAIAGGATALAGDGLVNAQGGTNNTNTTIDIAGAVALQELKAVNTNNTFDATTVTNGAVTIGPNAFSGFNGIGNFVMNTGNQNNVEGALIVNVVSGAPAP
ncbi:MAG TPA: hypothetical protein VN814_10110 [Caulobacteraceae bacterium]|nr:hypothetical protein [Caulobacteraceae bacterium]